MSLHTHSIAVQKKYSICISIFFNWDVIWKNAIQIRETLQIESKKLETNKRKQSENLHEFFYINFRKK